MLIFEMEIKITPSGRVVGRITWCNTCKKLSVFNMNFLLILSISSFSTPSLVCPFYPADSGRADFPHHSVFDPCQIVRVLSNVQNALLPIYKPEIGSSRYFLSSFPSLFLSFSFLNF